MAPLIGAVRYGEVRQFVDTVLIEESVHELKNGSLDSRSQIGRTGFSELMR
jgi:hypothetical protein